MKNRLIDANKLKGDLNKLPMMSNWGETFMLKLIDEQTTIDPETLPIVQELRAQLAKVMAERDRAMSKELLESVTLCLEKAPDKAVYVPRAVVKQLAQVLSAREESKTYWDRFGIQEVQV